MAKVSELELLRVSDDWFDLQHPSVHVANTVGHSRGANIHSLESNITLVTPGSSPRVLDLPDFRTRIGLGRGNAALSCLGARSWHKGATIGARLCFSFCRCSTFAGCRGCGSGRPCFMTNDADSVVNWGAARLTIRWCACT